MIKIFNSNEIIRTESNDFYLSWYIWIIYGDLRGCSPKMACCSSASSVSPCENEAEFINEAQGEYSPNQHRDQPAWNLHHFLFAYNHCTIIQCSEEKQQYESSKKQQLTMWLWLFLLGDRFCCLCCSIRCSIRSSISNCSCTHQNNRFSHFLMLLDKDQQSESYLKSFGRRLILSHLNGADHALVIIDIILYDDNIFWYRT